MPTTRNLIAVFLLVNFGNLFAAEWIYWGTVDDSNKRESLQFFDASGITRTTEGTKRVWARTILMQTIERYAKDHGHELVVKNVTTRPLDYSPKLLSLPSERARHTSPEALKQAIAMIGLFETVANSANVPIATQRYYEIDCEERRIRLLQSATYKSNGSIDQSRRSFPGSYSYVAPGSNGEVLHDLICLSQ